MSCCIEYIQQQHLPFLSLLAVARGPIGLAGICVGYVAPPAGGREGCPLCARHIAVWTVSHCSCAVCWCANQIVGRERIEQEI